VHAIKRQLVKRFPDRLQALTAQESSWMVPEQDLADEVLEH
jgi:hypothetical protein